MKVELDGNGLARFEIAHPVAWDSLEWTTDWQIWRKRQMPFVLGRWRNGLKRSRATIRHFLDATSPSAVKVFDVNLRQAYYSPEVLSESMRLADIVKLNDEELPKIMSLKRSHKDELSSAEWLIRTTI